MFVKLAVLACAVAASTAAYNGPLAGGQPAALYPAGVSPQACPNFPNCDNPALAANPDQPAVPQQWNQPQPSWNQGQQWNQPQPSWNQPAPNSQWNAAPISQYNNADQERLNRGEYIGDGDYHGEGLAEALAPGYESQARNWNTNNNAPSWQAAIPPNAQQAHGVGQIPAGVDARSCPNYPFCG